MTTSLETYRRISREIKNWTPSSNAWDSAIQNANDTIGENSLQQTLERFEVIVPEYEDPVECAVAAVAISTMQGLLCSADEWSLTKRDIAWFARRGVVG